MHHVTPPLQRMERYVSVFVNFLVLTLFAFVSAELHLVGENFGALLASPVAHGVYLGAVLGKPLGIIGVTWVLVRLGFARLPRGMDWPQVVTVGIMGGVGSNTFAPQSSYSREQSIITMLRLYEAVK